jgi:TusA-related sulfurtransferase
MAAEKHPSILDLRGIPCPQNVSRLLIHMTGIETGSILEVLLDGGEPFDNVMQSLELEDIQVVDVAFQSGTQRKIRLIVK